MLNKKDTYKKTISLFLILWLIGTMIVFAVDIGVQGGKSPTLQTPIETPEQAPEPPPPVLPETPPPSVEGGNNNVQPPPKQYLLMIKAKVDGLQLRAKPSSTSASLGAINKNDLVLLDEPIDNAKTLPNAKQITQNDTSFYSGDIKLSQTSNEDNMKALKNGNNERASAKWYKTRYKNQTAYISASSTYVEIIKFEMPQQGVYSVLQVGLGLLGTKYVYGAQRYHWGNGVLNSSFSITAFDCSSFTQYIYYKSNKILLNTTSRTQSTQGKLVSGNLKVGDVMFFTNSSRAHLSGIEKVGHVGIYFGNNYILHTASDYAVVEPISNTRWGYYLHARRFL